MKRKTKKAAVPARAAVAKPAHTPRKGFAVERGVIVCLLVIAAIGCIAYANSLNGKLLWDDEALVKDNLFLKSWSKISYLFTESIGTGAGKSFGFYRPIQSLTYMVDYSLWRLNPFGYHLQSALWHIAASLCVFVLIYILYGDLFLSLVTGLLFAVHPVHTEAVSYVSGRADPICLVFMLLTFIFYIKEKPLLTAATYVLAILSRENVIILPFLILLYHFTFRRKMQPVSFSAMMALVVGYLICRVTVLQYLLPHVTSGYHPSFLDRLPGSFVALAKYVRLLFLPFGLHMEYGGKLFFFSDPGALIGIGIFIASLVFLIMKARTRSLVFFGVAWFYIAILPVSNVFYTINAYMAEHWLYVPSIGFFLIIAHGIRRLYESGTFKTLAIAILACLVIFYGVLTMKQNYYWSDPIPFYERILKYEESARVSSNLGILYYETGKRMEAIALFKKATELDSEYVEAWNNLGKAYNNLGDKEKAVEYYKKAIALNPNYAKAIYNLGVVYISLGKKEEALAQFKRAIELFPHYAEAYYNAGNMAVELGKVDEAIVYLKKAVEANPEHAWAYCNLGTVYTNLGKYQEALGMYQKAIAADPRFAVAYHNMAATYLYMNEFDRAQENYDKAMSLGYNMPTQLGEVLKARKK